jgi:acyl carrier protein
MSENEFLNDFVDNVLDTDVEVKMDTLLVDIDEWDSLGVVGFIADANTKYGKKVTPQQVKEAKTPRDLFELLK